MNKELFRLVKEISSYIPNIVQVLLAKIVVHILIKHASQKI